MALDEIGGVVELSKPHPLASNRFYSKGGMLEEAGAVTI